jgi:glyoxylase-like metal-dependent hydrolase (beta-lactamase superfamily II)
MTAHQWKIGSIKVTRVIEIEAFGGMRRILPDASYEAVKDIPWLFPHFADGDGRLGASIHTLIVETPECRIVVDTCVGNDKDRAVPAWNQLQTTFLADFEATGYALSSIDRVLCTHLHVDHVGWNTRRVDGRWIPTFENARYLMGADEVAFWRHGEDDARFGPIFEDSIKPIFDADMVDLVRVDHQIAAGVRLISTPGHTPGHVSVLLESEGETGFITGDMLHHPCQFARPHWCAAVDHDKFQAIRTRNAIFERFADSPTLIIGTHFATPTVGHLVRDGDVYRLNV